MSSLQPDSLTHNVSEYYDSHLCKNWILHIFWIKEKIDIHRPPITCYLHANFKIQAKPDLADKVEQHQVNMHAYADDTQLAVSVLSSRRYNCCCHTTGDLLKPVLSVVGPSLSQVRQSGIHYWTVSATRRSAAIVSDNCWRRTNFCVTTEYTQRSRDASWLCTI